MDVIEALGYGCLVVSAVGAVAGVVGFVWSRRAERHRGNW